MCGFDEFMLGCFKAHKAVSPLSWLPKQQSTDQLQYLLRSLHLFVSRVLETINMSSPIAQPVKHASEMSWSVRFDGVCEINSNLLGREIAWLRF